MDAQFFWEIWISVLRDQIRYEKKFSLASRYDELF
jgi:hypothetical protein